VKNNYLETIIQGSQ